MAKLFIVGFPKDMEEIELVEMFSAHGTVNTVTIVTDIQTGASKGYGFITMTDDAGANRAIAALDGAAIDDRQMSVRFADDKKSSAVTPQEEKSQRPSFVKQQGLQAAIFPPGAKKKRPRRSN